MFTEERQATTKSSMPGIGRPTKDKSAFVLWKDRKMLEWHYYLFGAGWRCWKIHKKDGN